jgi:hypothetical protein
LTALSGVTADKILWEPTGRKHCQFLPAPRMSTHTAHRGSGVRDPQLLPMSFSFAALFGLTAADNFQGETGHRGSAADFFLTQECQYKKEAAIAHGVHGPSRSHHLSGASSPTPQNFQGKTGQRGSAADFFSAQECQYKKQTVIAHGICGPSRSHHLSGHHHPPRRRGVASGDCGRDPSKGGTRRRVVTPLPP